MAKKICGIIPTIFLLLTIYYMLISYAHGFSVNTTLLRVKRYNCEYHCDNGDCISHDNICDGIVDCADGSDETPAKCSDLSCSPYLFRCNYGPCIDKNKVCNGFKDCADNSDEIGFDCSFRTSACSPLEYRCNSGQCIDAYALCDGKKDCNDGSDEIQEKCGGVTCAPFLFQCSYGPCVDWSARCNGVNDCVDRSDELDCSNGRRPRPPVSPATPVSGSCILLNHPPNGQFKISSNTRYIPNTVVGESVGIELTCNSGYVATGLRNGGKLKCIAGKWTPEQIPQDVCKKRCPQLNDPTIVASCSDGTNKIDCSEAFEGTTADTRCASFYTYNTTRSRMICRNGDWTPNLGSCELCQNSPKLNVYLFVTNIFLS